MNFTIQQSLKGVDGPSKSAYDEDDKARGPVPVNPFTTFRSDIGLNLNQLSIYTGINNKALARLERGMYVNPLPRAVDYWTNRGVCTEGELLSDYENYRYLVRRRNEFYLGPTLLFAMNEPVHPLRQLRRTRPSLVDNQPLPVGLFDFCAALCLPLDSIQGFEKKWRTVQSVPKELKLALNQTGYTREQIAFFEKFYKEWRKKHSVEVEVT